VSILTSVLGGIGLFLLGMWLLTEGLKIAAGGALRNLLQSWTRSSVRGFLVGILLTGAVQSSSAVTVAMIGFVNAGLLSLNRTVWVILGAALGTTMTGWLVAAVGIRVDIGALALPMIGAGMILRLTARGNERLSGAGQALAGFGLFFLGVGVLQTAFSDLAPLITTLNLTEAGWLAGAGFLALGVTLTVLTQSSSAAIAIILTASATGEVPLGFAAAAVVGANIGTTSTSLFASMGASPRARRVASAHILFNLFAGMLAILLLPLLTFASREIAGFWGAHDDIPVKLALFHTLFNIAAVAAAWPFVPRVTDFLSKRFVSLEERIGRPQRLDDNLLEVPSVALNGLVQEVCRMIELSLELAREAPEAKATNPRLFIQKQNGILSLGQEIRAFIGKLGRAPLPLEVVEALADMVRAVQHAEEIVETSAALARSTPPPKRFTTGQRWRRLQEIVTESLVFDPVDLSSDDVFGLVKRRRKQVRQPYEQLKSEYLHAAARGELTVEAADRALQYIRDLRDLVDSSAKARRRLQPWLSLQTEELSAEEPPDALDQALPGGGAEKQA